MSNEALNWAFSQKVTPTRKLVLVALANRADKGWKCWPLIKALTEDTSLSDRALRYALKSLEASGLISVRSENGKGSVYTLASGAGHPGISCTPASNAHRQDVPDTPASGAGTPASGADQRARLHMNPKEPKENPKNLRRDEEDLGAPPVSSPEKAAYELPLRSKANEKPKMFPVSREHFEAWVDAYPLVDVRAALKEIKAWLVSNPVKRPASDMLRFVNRWLKRAQNERAGQSARASPGQPTWKSPAQRRLEANMQAGEEARELLFGKQGGSHA